MLEKKEQSILQNINKISKLNREKLFSKHLISPTNNSTIPLEQSRIIQKNLVYIIGLSSNLINKESELKKFEYFGQYGKIIKLVINKNKIYNNNKSNEPNYSCHITYSNETESSLAILALENSIIDNHLIKASYGTNKYCNNFLKNSICMNKDCVYLHSFADSCDILTRDEMNNNKNIFAYQLLMAIHLSKILTKSKRVELEKIKNIKTYFPNVYSVYNKDIVICYLRQNINQINNIDNCNNNFSLNKNDNSNLTLNNINKIYCSKNKSRFNFVNDKEDNNKNSIYKIEVPIQVQHFISENLRYSIISRREQNEIIDYYFSHSYESDDIWGYLISTLNMWKEFQDYPNDNYSSILKNDNDILIDKFNTC